MQKRTLQVLVVALVMCSCSPSDRVTRLRLGLLISGLEGAKTTSAPALLQTMAYGKADLLVSDAQGSRSRQLTLAEGLLKKKIKVLVVSCVDPEDAGSLIDMAKAAQVPIVFFGDGPRKEDLVKWDKAYFVGTDSAHLGQAQGELAASVWASPDSAQANKDGILQYAVIAGKAGSAEAMDRTVGAVGALAKAGMPVSKLAEEATDWDGLKAKELMAKYTARFGRRLDVVLCNNEALALGAASGRPKAQGSGAGQAAIFAIGGEASLLSAIADDKVKGTVVEDQEGTARGCLALAKALVAGGDLAIPGLPISDNKYLWVAPVKVTSENLDGALKSMGAPPRR